MSLENVPTQSWTTRVSECRIFPQGSRTLIPFVSQRTGQAASSDLCRRDATVSRCSWQFLKSQLRFTVPHRGFVVSVSGCHRHHRLCLLIPVHLIDVYNVIEAVRDAGLNAVELNAGISVTRLENLVSSMFNQLSKRLPTTHTINPRESTVLLVEFILAAVDWWLHHVTSCSASGPRKRALTWFGLNVLWNICLCILVSRRAVWLFSLWRRCWPLCVEGNWWINFAVSLFWYHRISFFTFYSNTLNITQKMCM